MTPTLRLIRGDVGRAGAAPRRRLRRRAARARPRRHELPQLPARRRPGRAGGHPRRARHRLGPGRGQGHRVRRPSDDVQRPVAGRADPEGRRHDARAPDGGGRAASLPRRGRPLPRPDDPLPRRRVEPRQVDGPDRGLPPRRACSSRPRRRSSTRAAGRSSGRRSRSSRSAPRAPSAPTRRRPTAASRSSSARCRAGRSTRSRATSMSSSSPPSTATSTRRASAMIPFERQFQTFHSVQNYFLLNELLAPGFPMPMVDTDALRAARGRLRPAVRRASVLLRPGGHAAGAPGRGGPGALGPPMRAFAYERPTRLDDAARPARRARPGGAPARRRDRPDHPSPRRDDPAAGRRRPQADRRARRGDPRDRRPPPIGATTVMTDIAADHRIRRDYEALAEAAAVVGSVQIRNRATLAGNICNASPAADTAPALLVYGAVVVAAGPAGDAADPDRRLLRPVGRHDAGRRRARHGHRAAAPRGPAGIRPRPADPTARPRPRLGHAGLRGPRRRDDPAGVRQPRPAAGPRRRRDRPARRPRGAGPREAGADSRRCSWMPARRRARCGRAPSTAWRCCTSSACARSARRSSGLATGSVRR